MPTSPKKRFWFVVAGHVEYDEDKEIAFENMPCVRVYLKREQGHELLKPTISTYVTGSDYPSNRLIVDQMTKKTISSQLAATVKEKKNTKATERHIPSIKQPEQKKTRKTNKSPPPMKGELPN